MSEIREIETRAPAAAITRAANVGPHPSPYPPSWANRFAAWVRRPTGSSWLFYLWEPGTLRAIISALLLL